jgi:hypothetical protein
MTSRRRFIGLLVVAVLCAATLVSLPATASRLGCVAVGAPDDECTFVSPGGTIKAVAVGTAYSVIVYFPSGGYKICIAGSTGVAQKSCPAPQGSTVYVSARFAVVAALLLWT